MTYYKKVKYIEGLNLLVQNLSEKYRIFLMYIQKALA